MKLSRVYFTKKYATGSLVQRYDALQEYTSRIYSAVMDKYDAALRKNNRQSGHNTEEFISLRKVERITKKILPERLSFKIRQNKGNETGDYFAAINYYYRFGHCKKMKIILPTQNRKLSIDDLPHFMHEITHLLDNALNPIGVKVSEKLFQKGMFNKVQKLYCRLYYTDKDYTDKEIPMEQIENRTKEFLEGLSTEDKLLVLKYFKIELWGEKKASDAAGNCYNKLNIVRNRRFSYKENCRFEEKLKLINKMRYEIICEERKNVRSVIIPKTEQYC